MHRHAETRVLPYTPEQMFDLVADIERYNEFLPWVTGAHITERKDGQLLADLVIGFGPMHERFTSKVVLDRPKRIEVVGVKGPFHHLNNQWTFEPAMKDGTAACAVGFSIDFAFKSFVLQAMMGALFGRSVDHMVEAFEGRAADLHLSKRAVPGSAAARSSRS
jgi:coenzyme Q-binding protein COQ10